MSYIKILRLKSGEDIIGFIEPVSKTTIKIRYPVLILIQYDNEEEQPELLMKYWLPVSLITKNQAEISVNELQIKPLEVNEEFKEYYLNYLNNFIKVTDEVNSEENYQNKELLKRFLETIDTKALGKAH